MSAIPRPNNNFDSTGNATAITVNKQTIPKVIFKLYDWQTTKKKWRCFCLSMTKGLQDATVRCVKGPFMCNLLCSFHDTTTYSTHKKYGSMSVMWTSYVYCINWSQWNPAGFLQLWAIKIKCGKVQLRIPDAWLCRTCYGHHLNQSGHGKALRLTLWKLFCQQHH